MDTRLTMQNENFSGDGQEFKKVRKSQKSFILVRWNLGNPVKNYPGIIVHQRHTDGKQMGLLRKRYTGLRKELLLYCCNPAWMKKGGIFHMKNLLKDICGAGEGRLTKMQATTTPDQLWPEIWSSFSKAAQRKEKQQWVIEKPKLDNARKLRCIYVIDPEDVEVKETMKKTRWKSWNCMQKQLCPVRSRITSRGKLVANPTIEIQNMHASWKLTNLRESVGRELCQKIMKFALQGKGSIHEVITILCTSSFPCLEQCKYWMRT